MAMFGSLGFPELIFIFLLALLIFGPKKLPELGRTLGKAMAEFRKATTDLKRTINAELIEQELREADPRKMVRDSLREAKASLENAVRLDDERATRGAATAATAAATAATAGAGAFADVAEGPDPRAQVADPSAPSAPPAPADPAATAAEAAEPPRPAFEPPGAIARGARVDDDYDDDPSEPPPKAPQPATSA